MPTSTSQFAFITIPMNRTRALCNFLHGGVIMLCGSEVYPNETPRNEIWRDAVHRYQLPLNLNFANSIHKGQGQSCDRLHTYINSSVCP